MKKILFIISFSVLLLFPGILPATAQKKGDHPAVPRNSIRLTLGGNGIIFSGEYSRIISVRPSFFLDASIGAGAIPMTGGIVIPHQLTWNKGKNTNFLELGIGGTFWTGKTNASAYEERDYSYSLSPVIGYRKLFGKKRWTFRVFATPLIHVAGSYIYENWAVTPWGGLSIGFNF